MNYVDVFISHKMEDADKALALQKIIQDDLKFSCYIDADDPEIAMLKKEKSVDKRVLADLLRGKLRNCRCFIYAYSAQSLRSRWMQWELGFFDGRWGPRQIGLYDLDEGRAASEVQTTQGDNSRPGVPEYLHIYTGLQRDSLQAFLETACSARGLADRADVDVIVSQP